MWDNLKASIASVVRTNNNQEITGANLQNVLNTIVNTVGANATFAGIAVPSTNPGTPDGPVFYIACEPGVYSNFNLTLVDGLYILENKTGSWVGTQINTGAAFEALIGYYNAVLNGASITVPEATTYRLTKGGVVRLKMLASGTTATTLTIGNATDIPIWYNGAAVSSDNTWEANEIISVFYDGTRFMASNSQGSMKMDEIPMPGSSKPVKSNGIYQTTPSIQNDDNTTDLDLTDENGNVLVRFSGGHVQTKNFDSENVGVEVEDYPENDFGISDENGNVIVRFKGGHVQTKNFDSESITTDLLQYRKIGLIRHTTFNSTTLPNGWNNEGNMFVLTSNGAQTPSNGSISTMLEYQQYSDLDSDVVTFRITMNAASKFYLTRYNLKYASKLGGQIVLFDFINKKVVVYAATKKGTTPSTILAQYTIPFNFVAGDYSISLWRWAEIKRFIIQGGGQTVYFEYNSASNVTSDGRAYDKYGITFIEGNFIVKSASFSSQMAAEPDLLIVGDSVTNGDTIRTSQGGTYKNRYASLVSEKTLCSICALGGNRSDDIARNNAMYLDIFKPKKVLYAVCLNDTNASTWQTNAEAFISSWEAKGAEVILSTWWPKSGSEAVSAAITNYVKNSGHRYVDFRSAMTVDGLGVTLKSGLFLSDAFHPNPAGHALMAKTLENDISDIINL